jgi:hypothetical protein
VQLPQRRRLRFADVNVAPCARASNCNLRACIIVVCHRCIAQEGKGTKAASILVGRHTTDTAKYGMQSVLETNDLNEIMNMVRPQRSNAH